MLRLLREAGGSLLDDEVLLGTLNNSRSTSAAINVRVAEAQATEASINAARESYRPAAARASTLYFVVSGLSAIDSMCARPCRLVLCLHSMRRPWPLKRHVAGTKHLWQASCASSSTASRQRQPRQPCQSAWQTSLRRSRAQCLQACSAGSLRNTSCCLLFWWRPGCSAPRGSCRTRSGPPWCMRCLVCSLETPMQLLLGAFRPSACAAVRQVFMSLPWSCFLIMVLPCGMQDIVGFSRGPRRQHARLCWTLREPCGRRRCLAVVGC